MDSKLLAGSSKGTTYLFNWGEFGYHCEEFTGFKQPVSCLLPVTETVAVTGWEDGKIRQVICYLCASYIHTDAHFTKLLFNAFVY